MRKLNSNLILLFLGLMLFFPHAVFAQAKSVKSVRSVCTVGGSSPTYKTIAEALSLRANCKIINIRAGTYYENLNITTSVHIKGAGSSSTIIDGSYDGLVFNIAGGTIASGPVTIKDLTMTHGTGASGYSDGGAIFSAVPLTIDNVIFDGNSADRGGALYIETTATVSNSTFTNNYAYEYGGAAYASVGTDESLTLTNVAMTDNHADQNDGALYGTNNIFISNSTFTGNTASSSCGAISVRGTNFSLTSSTVSNNTAETSVGGGLCLNSSNMTISNSVISGNKAEGSAVAMGGGFYIQIGGGSITDTTISDNSAYAGGGGYSDYSGSSLGLETIFTRCNFIDNKAADYGGGIGVNDYGFATITDSTISNNTSTNFDGGIFVGPKGVLNLSNSTVSTNTAVGIGGLGNMGTTTINNSTIYGNTNSDTTYSDNIRNSTSATGPLTVNNSIIAGSTTNCSGAITSSGYNLDSGNTCGFAAVGDISGIDPLLGALANNGGTTETHKPLAGSPVIDAGSPTTCTPTDQTGAVRTVCDIGAVEF